MIGAALVIFGQGNPLFISAGTTLMFGAVTEWLTPTPKREAYSDVKSWTLSGPSNTVEQGATVPVIYGEVLTGSQVISAGISVADLSPEGSTGPFVTIGGRTDYDFVVNRTGDYSMVASLSMAPSNLQEPYEITWSYTGFPTLVATLWGEHTSSVRLSVIFPVTNSEQETVTNGALTVSVKGLNPVDKSEVTVTTSAAIRMTIRYDDGQSSN